jgi:hypothetical protein
MGERSMKPSYTTVLDAGDVQLPSVPLAAVLAVPVLLVAVAYVAKARKWRLFGRPAQLAVWVLYLSYAPMVLYQYWGLWHGRSVARDAMQMSIEAGHLQDATIDRKPNGLFLQTTQRFEVNGVDFEYRHQELRYLDFLMPQAALINLPLAENAEVRVTYRRDDEQLQLLRFEIAKHGPGAHD